MLNENNLVDRGTEEYKERVTSVLQQLKDFTKDIDDAEIKLKVTQFLKSISDSYMFVAMGEVKAGKSSFINALLGEKNCAVSSAPCTNIIHEVRYGEENAELLVSDLHKRQFSQNPVLKNIAVVDTSGTNSIVQGHQALTEKFIPASDLLIVILSVTNPHTDSVWELLKDIKNSWNKKVVFVLQQKDLVSEEHLQKSINSVRNYAIKLGIPEPLIFAVSAEEEINGLMEVSGYTPLRDYIKNTVTDSNSLQLKQKSNIGTVNHILKAITSSFDKRYQQYEEDLQIVSNINRTIDSFRETHDKNVKQLLERLLPDIENTIEEYRVEIIRRLDPHIIKERFKDKGAFELFLSTLNDNYKNIMNKSIERKTQQAMKSYLFEMEEVLNEACKYLENRKVMLDFEDKIYGTLSQSKTSIVSETKSTINQISGYNKSLFEASEELFMGVWEARRKFDAKRKLMTTSAVIAGMAGTGAAVGMVVSTAAAAVAVSASAILVPILVGVLSTYAIGKLAHKFSGILFEADMMKEVNNCIDVFNGEVKNSKNNIINQLSEFITQLFENELKSMEKNFLEFRTTTYIDDDKIPKLKAKLELLEKNSQELFLYL